jgi:hypothetical protein
MTDRDKLVEKIARSMARQAHSAGGTERIADPYTPDADYWNALASAALSVARAAIKEECARVAEVKLMNYDTVDEIPAAIRAME